MEIRVEGSLDQAMRVLKRKLAKEGVFKEMKKRASTRSPASAASANVRRPSAVVVRNSAAVARPRCKYRKFFDRYQVLEKSSTFCFFQFFQ